MSLPRQMFLAAYSALFTKIARPLIFRASAMQGHARALDLMRRADQNPLLLGLLRAAHRLAFESQPTQVGGAALPLPCILAAGWVKGDGFDSEARALDAARSGRNIMPGWRSMPALLGPVEFGSFTRWPRLGNTGTVLWRDPATRSTQNRIGLKNPGVEAAAEFLAARKAFLPEVYGINVAVTPGLADPAQQNAELLQSLDAFLRRGVIPTWFTLNLSCPNTEDDPTGNQSEELAALLTGSAVEALRAAGQHTPLWVKVGPTLSERQVCALLRAFAATGVRAVVMTNTLPEPAPDDPGITAGVGGGRLHTHAVEVTRRAAGEIARQGWPIDLIGCGGVEDARTRQDFVQAGAAATQYLSALIYHGPLVGALIQKEAQYG
jgi:dihydroorotate dehydrogenase